MEIDTHKLTIWLYHQTGPELFKLNGDQHSSFELVWLLTVEMHSNVLVEILYMVRLLLHW